MSLHIGIVSILFDRKPEGICTGRLVRALLDGGCTITLYTSKKADCSYQHEKLKYVLASHRPREPQWFFKLLSRLQGGIANNFYLWGRRIIKTTQLTELPDVFYGRAWPHGSLVAAYDLAKHYQRPLMLHFSDPFPPPNEALGEERFMRELQQMVDSASALTFTNAETITYESKFLKFESELAHVIPHVGPKSKILGTPEFHQNFYYIGALSRHRPADPLLAGFQKHKAANPEARFYFVGTSAEYLLPVSKAVSENKYGVEGVEILPFSRHIVEHLRAAAVLVSIDVNLQPAIFTPTKIIEYLQVDRSVLAITPEGSPVDKLLKQWPATAVSVNQYTANAIAEGMHQAASLPYDQKAYQSRFDEMMDFQPEAVARKLEVVTEACVRGAI